MRPVYPGLRRATGGYAIQRRAGRRIVRTCDYK